MYSTLLLSIQFIAPLPAASECMRDLNCNPQLYAAEEGPKEAHHAQEFDPA